MPSIRQLTALLLTSVLFSFSPFSFAETKKLIITGSSTWQPFSFINRFGQPDGIMVDFWRLYGKANNVDVTFELKPWSESLEYARSTPNVIHGGLGYTGDRAKTLAFSRELPLNHYNVHLFAQKDRSFEGLDSLDSAIVGTVKDSTKHAFLISRIPEKNIRLFPTFGSLNDAAYRGEVDVFIDDYSTALYDMRHTGNSGQFTSRQKLYSFPMHFAVSKDSKSTIAKVERGLNNIDPSDLQAIYDKWLPQNKLHLALPWLNKTAQYLIFLGSMVLLTVGLFLYHRLLKHRTAELKSAVKALKDSKQKLETATQNDPLTGTKTRHQFFTALSDKRFSPSPYVVAVLDIDHLKQVNESYGQDVGDMAIKHLATQLRLQLSSQTLCARLGGGEFAVLFDLSDSSQAQRKLQQLQKTLQLSLLYIDQQVVPVKFSSGIACYPYDGESGEKLVRIASTRMRANKQSQNNFTAGNNDDDLFTEHRWA
ncbi:ABC transporter substrate-binding protein [Grimontia sp. AD028]|uniref:transporter substrate-binding domain-containing diguanylate cyclase n=1 Tax=Grimontia sp. AD028 TaxID=1581149 RepID=UPI00061AABC2|nr:GGDEF domain-containing protein [Grimontia sp. AD028]KKD61905.1 ABC transporter substrate-binding protein [Grimontia sp. AD028]